MNKSVISVQINGPGKLVPSNKKPNRKPRPKAAFIHKNPLASDSFTTGLSSVSLGELRNYFPSPVASAPINYDSIHKSYSSQAMESPRDNETGVPKSQISPVHTKQEQEIDTDWSRTNLPCDVNEKYSKFYYRYYPNFNMTELERKKLNYTPCKTPTIIRQKPDVPNSKPPPRWNSASYLRKTAYHLAELSLENEHTSTSFKPSVFQLRMLNADDDTLTQKKKPRAKSCYTQTSLRSTSTPPFTPSPSIRPVSSFVRVEPHSTLSHTEITKEESQSIASRHFQKRNELLRQQLQIYIRWKSEQQLKERMNMASGEAYRQQNKKPRILTSSKERRLRIFNDIMNETENELRQELEEVGGKSGASTPVIDEDETENHLDLVDKDRDLTDWLSKREPDTNEVILDYS